MSALWNMDLMKCHGMSSLCSQTPEFMWWLQRLDKITAFNHLIHGALLCTFIQTRHQGLSGGPPVWGTQQRQHLHANLHISIPYQAPPRCNHVTAPGDALFFFSAWLRLGWSLHGHGRHCFQKIPDQKRERRTKTLLVFNEDEDWTFIHPATDYIGPA